MPHFLKMKSLSLCLEGDFSLSQMCQLFVQRSICAWQSLPGMLEYRSLPNRRVESHEKGFIVVKMPKVIRMFITACAGFRAVAPSEGTASGIKIKPTYRAMTVSGPLPRLRGLQGL